MQHAQRLPAVLRITAGAAGLPVCGRLITHLHRAGRQEAGPALGLAAARLLEHSQREDGRWVQYWERQLPAAGRRVACGKRRRGECRMVASTCMLRQRSR